MLSNMQMQLFYENQKSNIFYTILSWLVHYHVKTIMNDIKSNQHLIEEESTHVEVYSDSFYKLLANLNPIHRFSN